MGRCGLDSSSLRLGPVVGSSEHGNEPSGSKESKEFLAQLSDYYILKKDSAPRNW